MHVHAAIAAHAFRQKKWCSPSLLASNHPARPKDAKQVRNARE